MEITRTDNLGLERSRSYTTPEQQAALGEEEQAVKQKQAVAPPKAPDKGAEGQGAAAPGSELASAAQSANAQAVSQMTTTSTEEDDDSEYQAILAKLNAGQSLSPSELSTLRGKNAAKYSQALQAQSARGQLRARMEEDPAHAMSTAKEAMARVAGASNEEKSAVLNALQKESADFASKYDQVELSRLGAQQAAALMQEEE